MLGNNEDCLNAKFHKTIRAVIEIWPKTIKNAPKMGAFPHLQPPRFFFKNRALSLLYPYGALTSCKELEKTNKRSLRYSKTDTHTDGQGRILRVPSGKPGVQNVCKSRAYIRDFTVCLCSCEHNVHPKFCRPSCEQKWVNYL